MIYYFSFEIDYRDITIHSKLRWITHEVEYLKLSSDPKVSALKKLSELMEYTYDISISYLWKSYYVRPYLGDFYRLMYDWLNNTTFQFSSVLTICQIQCWLRRGIQQVHDDL